ncbi:hypothetical protein PF1468 [Pyrococcus furiosus DSM 3638]|uniref:Uncharacterized protein n=2 Tax=Pyrococcus furiosus TaxID=2261 RepID=Q8U0W3_PYRFU|nr:hypothetical protein PF1468 [Pyrococcus furiosus DSM 3638]AFN04251.1 hypothetical protein PFC_06575 [Pyrococcus furiosus COM1]
MTHIFPEINSISSLLLLYNGRVLANIHDRTIKKVIGFEAIFRDRVIRNDIKMLIELIRKGDEPLEIRGITIEDYAMNLIKGMMKFARPEE